MTALDCQLEVFTSPDLGDYKTRQILGPGDGAAVVIEGVERGSITVTDLLPEFCASLDRSGENALLARAHNAWRLRASFRERLQQPPIETVGPATYAPAVESLTVRAARRLPVLTRSTRFVALGLFLATSLSGITLAGDPIKDMQNAYVAGKRSKAPRAYHFGSQGPGNVFSNHTSHSNRLIPVYVFGRKADIGSVTGKNSCYRDAEKIRKLYGSLPANTLNAEAEYCDQSDLYKVQMEAVARGAKYLFTVWFDGMDWETTRAAAIAKTGKVYDKGKGSGLNFQDYSADRSAQFGYFVTSPTHDLNNVDVNSQTLSIPAKSLLGGYDAGIAGANPWTPGNLVAPGYLKGQSANDADKAGVAAVGRTLHAYTDSSQSAGEFVSGVKSYNNGVNVSEDSRFVRTIFHELQAKGWKVGTATSVPFDHVSPAAMYAHNVHRDDYQDLARDMLGLPGIVQESGKDALHPGLDVVMGAGYGQVRSDDSLLGQGKNAARGQNRYIATPTSRPSTWPMAANTSWSRRPRA